jgi:hypothetical protein
MSLPTMPNNLFICIPFLIYLPALLCVFSGIINLLISFLSTIIAVWQGVLNI